LVHGFCLQFDELGDIRLQDDLGCVDLLLDVGLQAVNTRDAGFVAGDDCETDDGFLQGDILALSDLTSLDDHILHPLDVKFDCLVDEVLVELRNLKEVDGVGAVFGGLDAEPEVLVEGIGDEGHVGTEKEGELEQHIEQDVEGNQLILRTCFSLESGSVESDVPVGEVLEELEQFGDDGVESVLLHLCSDGFDEVLGTCDDPPVHKVVELAREGDLLIVGELLVVIALETVDVL
jgi:hypothetical protein